MYKPQDVGVTNPARPILVVLPDSGLNPDALIKALAATTSEHTLSVHLFAHLRISESPGHSPHSIQSHLAEAREISQERALGLTASLAAQGHKVRFHTTTGQPAVQAARLADELGAELIVVGETRPTLLERLFRIGFVDTLTRLTSCPIVLLPSASDSPSIRLPFPVRIRDTDWRPVTPKPARLFGQGAMNSHRMRSCSCEATGRVEIPTREAF